MSLTIYGIFMAIKYYLKADYSTSTCIIALANAFNPGSFSCITIHILWTSYPYFWDGFKVFYSYSAGTAVILYCMVAALYMYNCLGATYFDI